MSRTLVILVALLLVGCQAPSSGTSTLSAADAMLQAFQASSPHIGAVRTLPLQTFRDGYSGRLDFRDTRLPQTTSDDASDWTADGGTVEMYPSIGDAASRRNALVRLASQEGRSPERIYVYGTSVMRLSPRFTSEQANAYEASFRAVATHLQ
jgi:hypothetical protein